MRRFKLLKELPDVKAGDIGCENKLHDIIEWLSITKLHQTFPTEFVLSKPDWFEEVKGEPKDNKIYVGISKCCNKPAHKCNIKTISGEEDCLKFKCSECLAHCDIYTPSEPKKLGKIEPFQEYEGYCQTDIIDKINELVDAVNSLQRT